MSASVSQSRHQIATSGMQTIEVAHTCEKWAQERCSTERATATIQMQTLGIGVLPGL